MAQEIAPPALPSFMTELHFRPTSPAIGISSAEPLSFPSFVHRIRRAHS